MPMDAITPFLIGTLYGLVSRRDIRDTHDVRYIFFICD